jgi:hypothetical protein
MAARSTQVVLKNLTELTFSRKDAGLEHGVWTENAYPPETVKPMKTVHWESESDGMMTGTAGHVTFKTNAGELYIHWNNPYAGTNAYQVNVPAGYTYDATGGSGNNTTYIIFLTKKDD